MYTNFKEMKFKDKCMDKIYHGMISPKKNKIFTLVLEKMFFKDKMFSREK